MSSFRTINPFAFAKVPVTLVVVAVYIGISIGLIYTHDVVPKAPKNPPAGTNLTEAWLDLQSLTKYYHPYNSHANDDVHSWLVSRIKEIITTNDLKLRVEAVHPDNTLGSADVELTSDPQAIIFGDESNLQFASGNTTVYFEGKNIVVYVRGSEDDPKDWWRHPSKDPAGKPHGVLVNAHFDSISTAFGATDDGMGVVTVLQLINHYTTRKHQPKRGFVALLNDGEEDFLNGAWAFTQHPISRFVDTFLNLEGAGAGGQALLFRTTDTEVTRHYQKVPHPFGAVVSSDGFKLNLVRSQTDYVVFNEELGYRGLDVAFYRPRSRYHTPEDSVVYTSQDSISHMLTAAVEITKGLTSDVTTDFSRGKGTESVWFDLFASSFGVLELHTLFAITVTLLILGPITLLGLVLALQRSGKYYLYSRASKTDALDPNSPDETTDIQFGGWRGFFRFPIAFVLATGAVIGIGFLVTKINPYIVYSSPYAMWAMMLSVWFVVAWFILRGADFMRPSALHRAHSLIWMFSIFWIFMVPVALSQNNYDIASGYFIVVYFASIFIATSVAHAELFWLPKKADFIEDLGQGCGVQSQHTTSTEPTEGHENIDSAQRTDDDEGATETTALLSRVRRGVDRGELPAKITRAFGDEQSWSGSLPKWTWILQFLVLAPMNLILVGEVALLLTSSLQQTPADGSSAQIIYLAAALLSTLYLLPAAPFLHRFSSKIPTFFFLVFIGALIYSLAAFPFSDNNKLKVFFKQEIDLQTGQNVVSLYGLDPYVQRIISQLPSAAGQVPSCEAVTAGNKIGLVNCTFTGLAPNVMPSHTEAIEFVKKGKNGPKDDESDYRKWLALNITRSNSANEATFTIAGKNTRACRLLFDIPMTNVTVKGANVDKSFATIPKNGTTSVRLWRREWEAPWTVTVRWNETGGKTEKDSLGGRAVCLWSDWNRQGAIPALDEMSQYFPPWAIVSKQDDGLVEGFRRFRI